MSYHSSSRSSDRHRRDSGEDRHRRDSGDHRRSSRRSESPKAYKQARKGGLPLEFGRGEMRRDDEHLNVLQRLSTYENTPLQYLADALESGELVKIWTRNFKEIRGIVTGQIKMVDKHWNLVVKIEEEVGLMPKKSKTPFLRELVPDENIPDFPEKVLKLKKSVEADKPKEEADKPKEEAGKPKEVEESETEKETLGTEKAPKKKHRKRSKKKKKNATPKMLGAGLTFIRGDNIVMIAPKD